MKQRTGSIRAVVGALGAGAVAALWPLAAGAQAADRALEAPAELGAAVFLTVLGLTALFGLTGLGYLYRRERGLNWAFQRPDSPHDDHH